MVKIRLTKPKKFGTSDIVKSEGLFIDIKFRNKREEKEEENGKKKKRRKKRGRPPKPGKALRGAFKPFKKRGKIRLTRGVSV